MTAEQVVSYLLEEDGLDFLRESLRWVVQQLMEAEVTELVGAAHGERAPDAARPAHSDAAEARLQPHSRCGRVSSWAVFIAGDVETFVARLDMDSMSA
jgi:transposase-like protein